MIDVNESIFAYNERAPEQLSWTKHQLSLKFLHD